ncbi:MAG: ATP-binding protein [Longicatena sp.]
MNDEKVLFSFGWLALKLLGKSLYSNTWSAISELVANGFDANAKNVYVYINIVDKKNAVVEIIDDGTGIDSESIETYVKVGFNKRENGKLLLAIENVKSDKSMENGI